MLCCEQFQRTAVAGIVEAQGDAHALRPRVRLHEGARAHRLDRVGVREDEQDVVVERRPGLQHAHGFQQRGGRGAAVGRAERRRARIVMGHGQHGAAACHAGLAHDDVARRRQRDLRMGHPVPGCRGHGADLDVRFEADGADAGQQVVACAAVGDAAGRTRRLRERLHVLLRARRAVARQEGAGRYGRRIGLQREPGEEKRQAAGRADGQGWYVTHRASPVVLMVLHEIRGAAS